MGCSFREEVLPIRIHMKMKMKMNMLMKIEIKMKIQMKMKQTGKEILCHLITPMEMATEDETDTVTENKMALIFYTPHDTDINSEISKYINKLNK